MSSGRRVFLHIGAPKTGTTYLQDRLESNHRSLSENDVHLPHRFPATGPSLFQFRAALDLLDEDWGGAPGHAEGGWAALVRRVRRRTGTVVISHEILAAAPAAAIARAKADLTGGSKPVELHIVYTVRDLARQLPAAWQESVKQGNNHTFERFLNRAQQRKHRFARAFDLPSVLAAWGSGLPPEQVHVVTVPPRSEAADPDLLWQRFAQACDIDPTWAPATSETDNRSLGVAETQLLRRLNRRLERSTRREIGFDKLIRQMLAEDQLAGRRSVPVRLPPRLHPWVEDEAERWTEWITGSGVDVVGDLADLRPAPFPDGKKWVDPDKVRPSEQLDAAVTALSAMTREAARRPDPDQQLVEKVRTQARRMRGA